MKNNIYYKLKFPGPKSKYKCKDVSAGFLDGLWHGFIALITLFFSFNGKEIRMYEVNNKGSVYDFGFLCGYYLSNVTFMYFHSILSNFINRMS